MGKPTKLLIDWTGMIAVAAAVETNLLISTGCGEVAVIMWPGAAPDDAVVNTRLLICIRQQRYLTWKTEWTHSWISDHIILCYNKITAQSHEVQPEILVQSVGKF